MTIAQQLTQLNDVKTSLKNALIAKGQSITGATPFADYATAIGNISSGGGSATSLVNIARVGSPVTVLAGATSTFGRGLFLTNDGSKLYMACPTNDKLFKWTLSTPWDISTVTYVEASASIAAKESNSRVAYISNNGTKMLVIGSYLLSVYNLPTPWSVVGATWIKAYDLNLLSAVGITISTGANIVTNPSETKLWITSSGDGYKVYEFNMVDLGVTDVTYSQFIELNSANYTVTAGGTTYEKVGGFTFSDDGLHMFSTTGSAGYRWIHRMTLTTPYDLSTIKYNYKEVYDITGGVELVNIGNIFLDEPGKKLIVGSTDNNYVNQLTAFTL